MNWIACSERLPETEAHCLVWTHNGQCFSASRRIYGYGRTGWFSDHPDEDPDGEAPISGASHWMHLPAPPTT